MDSSQVGALSNQMGGSAPRTLGPTLGTPAAGNLTQALGRLQRPMPAQPVPGYGTGGPVNPLPAQPVPAMPSPLPMPADPNARPPITGMKPGPPIQVFPSPVPLQPQPVNPLPTTPATPAPLPRPTGPVNPGSAWGGPGKVPQPVAPAGPVNPLPVAPTGPVALAFGGQRPKPTGFTGGPLVAPYTAKKFSGGFR